MRFAATCLCLVQLAILGNAQIPVANPFKHIIIIVQENRTPDNMFQGLCSPPFGSPSSCSTSPTTTQYNISTSNWLNKQSPTGYTQPTAVPFGTDYDLFHTHAAFLSMCDAGSNGICKMDGAASIICGPGKCPTYPQFEYVDNSSGIMNPYLELATQYGWANYMFQTNQGPSYPAHQFIFGGTSAPSASDDAAAVFLAENTSAPSGSNYEPNSDLGCLAPSTEWTYLISPQSAPLETKLSNDPLGAMCFSHPTLASLVDQKSPLTWKYYATYVGKSGGNNPGGYLWTAPNSIQEICQPDPTFQTCTGPEWTSNVDLNPPDVLTDISKCNLSSVSWVTPTGQTSDHAGNPNATGGPSWVASVVNAIGNDTTCESGKGYWSDTAIVITWDDWGGWYDHEAPTILDGIQGDYQYGFRVPLILVSAYTRRGYISNLRYDFGSLVRLIEGMFDLPGGEGALGFADARANLDFAVFFNEAKPRKFTTIDAPLKADFFIHDTSPPEPPDND